jgi:hypothetical protein
MTYPTLRRAFEIMLNDQGMGIHSIPLERVDFTQSNTTPDKLAIVEAALAKLSPEELETICIGDQEEWPPIYEKMGGWQQDLVHTALECMFENIFLGNEDTTLEHLNPNL